MIKSTGIAKTILQHDNHIDMNETKWDADYNGSEGNISLNVNENGNEIHKDFHFHSADLARILTMPSVNSPLERRLMNDYLNKKSNSNKIISNKRSTNKRTFNNKNRRSSTNKRNTKKKHLKRRE